MDRKGRTTRTGGSSRTVQNQIESAPRTNVKVRIVEQRLLHVMLV